MIVLCKTADRSIFIVAVDQASAVEAFTRRFGPLDYITCETWDDVRDWSRWWMTKSYSAGVHAPTLFIYDASAA